MWNGIGESLIQSIEIFLSLDVPVVLDNKYNSIPVIAEVDRFPSNLHATKLVGQDIVQTWDKTHPIGRLGKHLLIQCRE